MTNLLEMGSRLELARHAMKFFPHAADRVKRNHAAKWAAAVLWLRERGKLRPNVARLEKPI